MKVKITIEGMSCGHCVKHVKAALVDIGAVSVDVNLEKKLAIAEFNSEIIDEKIKESIEFAGYDVVGIEKV